MSLSPGVGAYVQEAANGVDTPESPETSGQGSPLGLLSPSLQPLKCGEIAPRQGPELAVGSPVEEVNCGEQPSGEGHANASQACVSDTPCVDTPQEEEEDKQEQEEQDESQEDTEGTPELSTDSPTVSGPPNGSLLPLKASVPSEEEAEEEEEEEEEQEEEGSLGPSRCQDPPCPPHVMAQVHVRNAPERERIARGMQDSKSLDEISQVCGGVRGRGGQAEGRRATISSALELEGTVSHDGELTHFITKNLEHKIRMSSRPSLDSDSEYSGRGRGSLRRPADIPPIDPGVLLDLQRHTQDVAQSVELMMRSLNGTIQNMTALSVGYIQTYRDSVDSLGEAVDMSIKGMYTLMARCEELDRSMQPIHALAQQIRDIKRTLDALETLCK
ncbi:BLOC-1-related complex subunit 6 [Megalops cyprinoides]|uniref:BLOC-1-related complex subunit 6 n=1 Tax=Megalops cyprinoides TaxID=118141 RepID=UPI001863C0D6|nr:BLOC-1-related complex subunit 6 [Megalops cyprinoides]